MNRLTKTFRNGEVHTLRTCCAPYYKKLSLLEDIEEDLKIELNILFQALNKTQSIFIKEDKNTIAELDQFIITHRVISKWQLILSDGYSYEAIYLNLSDYGKTWALNREELL